MRGAEALQHMRRSGAIPAAVTIIDGAAGWVANEWQTRFPAFAFLSIAADEPLHGLDLRCLVGLPVQVESDDQKRLGDILRRARDEKPARLIGVLFEGKGAARDVAAVYDSDGVATWRKS